MPAAVFRFYAELNDFLVRDQRYETIEVHFHYHETVKHLIESLNVPHTEVDVILVNGCPVDFAARLEAGDQVEIYPVSEKLKAGSRIHLRPAYIHEPSFVLDGHLGKLCSYLRLFGFDALYRNDFNDDELAEISATEERILLTRDRGLLKRDQVKYGYCVRSKSPRHQVVEILQRFDLVEKVRPFTRCAKCNGLLHPVSKGDVCDRLEPKTKQYYDEFQVCERCDQVYWRGSHFERLEGQLKKLLDLSRSS
jgi:uncharacterized protein with PIN domain